MALFLIPFVATLFLASVHVVLRRSRLTLQDMIEVFLLYLFPLGYGLAGLMGFIGHALRPEATAVGIGWPSHPHFQFELGSFELGLAIAAFLCLFVRNPYYWLGVAIVPAPLFLLAGGLHIHEALAKGNFTSYNIGVIPVNFLMPLTILGLVCWRLHLGKNRRG